MQLAARTLRIASLTSVCSERCEAMPFTRFDMASTLFVAALATFFTPTDGWITKSQANFGAQIAEISSQMNGVPSSRFVQAEYVHC